MFDKSQPQPDSSRSLGSDLVFFGRVSQALALVCLSLGIWDAVVAWAVRDCVHARGDGPSCADRLLDFLSGFIWRPMWTMVLLMLLFALLGLITVRIGKWIAAGSPTGTGAPAAASAPDAVSTSESAKQETAPPG